MPNSKPIADCCWAASAPATDYPRLKGRRRFDVAVVGGGIVGLTAAIELAAAGRSVALLEALRIGRQVTGRSTAKVTTQHGLIYRHLIDTVGRDNAKIYADANRAGVDWICRSVDRYDIACDLEEAAAYVFTDVERTRLPELDAEAEAALDLGLPADVVDRAPLPFPTGGALRFSGQFQFNPVTYLIGLARAAADGGIEIFEQTRATSVVRQDDGTWLVGSETGEIAARDVVLATAIPMAGKDDFTGRTQPRCHTCMAFEIDPVAAPEGMFIGLDEPSYSLRRGRDKDRTLLVVLGPRFDTGHDGDVTGRFDAIEGWTRSFFDVGEAAYRWTNEDYDTGDRLPFIGAPPEAEPGFYIATGFNAWGLSNGTAAGLLLRDLVTGTHNPGATLFAPGRDAPSSINRGGDTRSEVSSVDEIAPGEGGVVTEGDEKLAVWKDDDGTVHAFSAACTHAGCSLTWNNVDQSWDCPCHGSVFGKDGAVVHGPAVAPLEKKRLDRR
ncbi:MAG: FAD-dependent oxidoreductase [Hyphomicrobiaceae bacterium]